MFGLLFVQSAFNTLEWLRPQSVSETFSLYVLSTINFLAFIVLLMVLVRNLIKLRRERQVGAHFKRRVVVFSIGLSVLPVLFLFFTTTGFINRSIDKWFGLPGDEILKSASSMEGLTRAREQESLARLSATLVELLAATAPPEQVAVLEREVDRHRLTLARLIDDQGVQLLQIEGDEPAPPASLVAELVGWGRTLTLGGAPLTKTFPVRSSPSLKEPVPLYLLAGVSLPPSSPPRFLLIARRLPTELSESLQRIQSFQTTYQTLKVSQKGYRNTAMQTLGLVTLLVLFIAVWMAIHLSRGVADPVRKLAEATTRIRGGDLTFRADVVGADELAALATSFNEMTAELAENRRQLESSALDLQAINAALEERRQYIEAILQSLSAGVISLDVLGQVQTINQAALRLLRIEGIPTPGVALEGLLPEAQRDELRRLIRRAARSRSISQEVHFTLANQVTLDATVTVTALLDVTGQVRGAVIVIEDLSELIEAQRRAAWSEVARRMAHEIKNPLTPIRLSAERLAKHLLGGAEGNGPPPHCLTERQTQLVRECTGMIGTEVATLQRMVDEFSRFARLPAIRLEEASLNEVVRDALRLYDGHLGGVTLESQLDPELPVSRIDAEQLRQVLVNLIENALDFLADCPGARRLLVTTRHVPERESIELVVADTGPGIPLDHRERIFDPYFSTRKRGTGLGLAIVSRIVAEHHGRIRVSENHPQGAVMTVELPLISQAIAGDAR
jgi:PAS domain S-box-containing protein